MDSFIVVLETWLQDVGVFAYVVAPMVMAVVAILPIPAEAAAMLNGAIFGPFAGTMITWSGSLVGALISFELARGLGRPLASRLVKAEALASGDAVVKKAGWRGLIVLRLLPMVAFTAINWAAGLTDVPRWRFFWTTALGIIPGAILFTASGTGIAKLLESGASPIAWIAGTGILGFLAYVVVRRLTPKGVGPQGN